MTGRAQAGFQGKNQGMALVKWCIILLLLMSLLWTTGTAGAESADGRGNPDYEHLLSGKRVSSGQAYVTPEHPTVYLTFDDGPSRDTAGVLDVLKAAGIQGTFFVLGEQAQARPELIRRMVEEGHALGNHSYNHVYSELYSQSFDAFWDQIQRTEQVLYDIAGIRPRLVRAPGGTSGHFDAFYFYYLEQGGYEVHDWTADSGDARRSGVPAEEIYRNIARGPFPHEAIVLLHDGVGHEETLKALPNIIRLYQEKGYRFAPLTPAVDPVQFSAGKAKWPRKTARDSFERTLAEVKAHRSVLELAPAGQLAGTLPAPEVAMASGTSAAAGPDRLEIALGNGRTFVLGKGDYRYAGGHYTVSLRGLMEAAGGQVSWQEAERTATVAYGAYLLEYDFLRSELRVHKPCAWTPEGEGMCREVHGLPEMSLVNGQLLVPLRQTLERVNGRVLAYESASEAGSDTAVVRALLPGGWWGGWPLEPRLAEAVRT